MCRERVNAEAWVICGAASGGDEVRACFLADVDSRCTAGCHAMETKGTKDEQSCESSRGIGGRKIGATIACHFFFLLRYGDGNSVRRTRTGVKERDG